MAAIIQMDINTVKKVCNETEGIIVPANYNCPGQIVISGEQKSIENACEKFKSLGARRAIILPVGGAFHSPLMKPAKEKLKQFIEQTEFKEPICSIYQNFNANGVIDPREIKVNLIKQLVSPVKWEQSMKKMIDDGAIEFIEVGPGKVLQGLTKKINPEAKTYSLSI